MGTIGSKDDILEMLNSRAVPNNYRLSSISKYFLDLEPGSEIVLFKNNNLMRSNIQEWDEDYYLCFDPNGYGIYVEKVVSARCVVFDQEALNTPHVGNEGCKGEKDSWSTVLRCAYTAFKLSCDNGERLKVTSGRIC